MKRKMTQVEQSRLFKDTSKRLGCQESESTFEEKLKQIAHAKPKPKKHKKAAAQ